MSALARKWNFSNRAISLPLFHGIALLFAVAITAHSAEVATDRGIGGIAVSALSNERNSWAVVIGINAYNRAPRLNYAVNDAKSVVASLQELGFSSDKILLL